MTTGEKICVGFIGFIVLCAFIILLVGVLARPNNPPDDHEN